MFITISLNNRVSSNDLDLRRRSDLSVVQISNSQLSSEELGAVELLMTLAINLALVSPFFFRL